MKGKTIGFLARMGACLGLSVLALTARAEYVACETPYSEGIPLQSIARPAAGGLPNLTQIVWGNSMNVSSFSLSSAGQLSIGLKDIGWPNPLQELTLLVTDMHAVWERLDVTGSTANLLLDIAGPGQFFAAVFARTPGASIPGLYHLESSFAAPVPLPAAGWLLLSALGGLGIATRCRQR